MSGHSKFSPFFPWVMLLLTDLTVFCDNNIDDGTSFIFSGDRNQNENIFVIGFYHIEFLYLYFDVRSQEHWR